jgi:catechol 1,2-dioxygenase
MEHHFEIEPGEARLPKPPITGKADGARPQLEILQRR